MTPTAAIRSVLQMRPARPRTTGFGPLPGGRWTGGRASARSAVLTGVVVVILAHLGLAAVVETVRPQWRDPEYFYRQKRLTALMGWERSRGHVRPLIVVIGGSRPEMGLSPEHLGLGDGPTDPLVFDCVQSGALPVGERLNLARLLASGVTPDFVLVEVLPPVLADPGPMEDRVPVARLGYADLVRVRPYHTDPANSLAVWACVRATSWYSLRVPLMANWRCSSVFPPGPNRSEFLWSEMRLYGWSPFYPARWPAARREAGLAAAHGPYSRLLNNFRVAEVNDWVYRDLLGECRARGIRAALFVMPESPTFRGWYPPAARAGVTEYLGTLSRAFGVPVFDASAWVDDEAAFMDGHHLLGPGAEEFSRRFGRECVGPWVRGESPRGR